MNLGYTDPGYSERPIHATTDINILVPKSLSTSHEIASVSFGNLSQSNLTTESYSGNESVNIPVSDGDSLKWFRLLAAGIGLVVSLLGMFGNLITIAAYKRNRKLRTSFNFLIINLCAIDFVFSAAVIPTHMHMFLTFGVFERWGCIFVSFIYYASMSSSAINLVCIAINRYVGIVHSKLYRRIFADEYGKFWILGIWTISPLLYLPIPFIKEWSTSTLRCEIQLAEKHETFLRIYQVLLIVMLQVAPVIALTAFYRAILLKVKKCRKTVEHYPLTNTPTNCGSFAGHSCAMRSTNSPECSPGQPRQCARKGSVRRGSSKRVEAIVTEDQNDVNEGRKAIIMAYLQVPPASISPRKNPGALYKRSPPQTRTMVVEEDNVERNQVMISGTTSSPNLLDKLKDTSYVQDTRCDSTMKWCRQRSFSTGDEEIEPERGMVGDNGSDLKQMNSFEIAKTEAKTRRSYHEKSQTTLLSPSHFINGKSRSLETNQCTPSSKQADSLSPSPAAVRDNIHRTNTLTVQSDACILAHRPELKSTTSLPTKNSLNHVSVHQPFSDSTNRLNDSSLSITRRRSRTLTRQRVVNEEEPATLDNLKQASSQPNFLLAPSYPNSEPPNFPKKLENDTVTVGRLVVDEILPPCGRIVKHEAKLSKSSTEIELKKAQYAGKDAHISSERNHMSHPADFIAHEIEKGQQDSPKNNQEAHSKRILYHRGGSDRTGLRWFRRFRKSKNWSVTSIRAPKLRSRDFSEAKKDTVIKIVIDHATEEVTETWLGEEHDEMLVPEKTKQRDLYRSKQENNINNDLSIIPEQITNNNENSTDIKSQSNNSARLVEENDSKGKSWKQIFRNKWLTLLQKSTTEEYGSKDEQALQHLGGECDENKSHDPAPGANSDESDENLKCDGDIDGIPALSPKNKHQMPVESALWPGLSDVSIKSPTAAGKPVVMLPMPSLPLRPNERDPPVTQNDDDDDDALSRLPHIDSDSTCKCGRDDHSDGNESVNTSSDYERRDSDVLSSKEDAERLRKRREMNDSAILHRVKNVQSDYDDDNQSLLDLNSIDLGRRWSGQSDAASIYSERVVVSTRAPIERSHSACSRNPARRYSKRSDSSDTQGFRKSFYRKWSSKKASFASSNGSNASRRRRRAAERKLAHSGVTICIAFAICMLPLSITDIVQHAKEFDLQENIKFGFIALSWVHVVIDPLLYGFLNSQFRSEYKKILKSVWDFVRGNKQKRGLQSGRSAIIKAMRDQYQNSQSPQHQEPPGQKNPQKCDVIS